MTTTIIKGLQQWPIVIYYIWFFHDYIILFNYNINKLCILIMTIIKNYKNDTHYWFFLFIHYTI